MLPRGIRLTTPPSASPDWLTRWLDNAPTTEKTMDDTSTTAPDVTLDHPGVGESGPTTIPACTVASLRDDLERLRAAVREADEAAQHVYAASVAERIGQPYAAAKVAAIIARQDAACAALRALMPTEVSRG